MEDQHILHSRNNFYKGGSDSHFIFFIKEYENIVVILKKR